MSIYKVTQLGVPGKKLGDEMSEQEALDFLNSEHADKITVFPDAARARLDMRDATPSKPVGSVPGDLPQRGYHPLLGAGALSESSNVYVGVAAHANPAIRQPEMNERLRDANPGYKMNEARVEGDQSSDKAFKDAEAKTTKKPAPAVIETEPTPEGKVQTSAEAAQEKPLPTPKVG